MPGAPADAVAVEFNVPTTWDGGGTGLSGELRYLVEDGNGLAPGQGSKYSTSWGLAGSLQPVLVINNTYGVDYLYSACPAELELDVPYVDNNGVGQLADVLLVHLGAGL